MKFEWDENKNKINLEKRGIDLRDAEIVLSGPTVYFEDGRKNYDETRWIVYG
jgi:uncharacterized protein